MYIIYSYKKFAQSVVFRYCVQKSSTIKLKLFPVAHLLR